MAAEGIDLVSFYREQLEQFLAALDVTAEVVLDVGGAQRPVKGRTKSWDVGRYEILDLPDYDLDEPFAYPLQADLVFCLEVFEYVLVPTVALANIRRLLRPARVLRQGGKAIVTFPFVYPLHNEVELDSLRYTSTAVRRLASKAGLRITGLTARHTCTDTLVRYYREDGMHAAPGREHGVTGFIAEFAA